MNDFYKAMQNELNELMPQMADLRKELHSYPETAWNEVETRKRLLKALEGCRKAVHEPYLETDLVFDMGQNGDALLLRSDMDALKQEETGERPHMSRNRGAAHSCGHDGHMAMLCGAAILIDRLVKKGYPLPRPVRFVFQPAEEIECGGSLLAAAGILEGVKEVLAVHGWPSLPKGRLFSKSGPFFAAASTFSITIEGKATHGALPQNGLSPFPAAARMIEEIEKTARVFEGRAIVSPCIISGGSSDNIIPGSIEIRGTIRYYNRDHYSAIQERLSESASAVEESTHCAVKSKYISKYKIPLFNDGPFLEKLNGILKEGASRYGEIPEGIGTTEAKTVSEDFSFYTDKKPGALVLLGLGDETSPLHAQDFDFPEEVLHKGILLFTEAAYNLV